MCTFSIDFNVDAITFIQKSEQAIDDAGGAFTGDTSKGSFSISHRLARLREVIR